MLRALAALPETVSEPVDTLYFFFSGHGFRSTADGRDYPRRPGTQVEVEIAIDIDANGVMFCLVRELARRVQWAYQLNKFYKAVRTRACRNENPRRTGPN